MASKSKRTHDCSSESNYAANNNISGLCGRYFFFFSEYGLKWQELSSADEELPLGWLLERIIEEFRSNEGFRFNQMNELTNNLRSEEAWRFTSEMMANVIKTDYCIRKQTIGKELPKKIIAMALAYLMRNDLNWLPENFFKMDTNGLYKMAVKLMKKGDAGSTPSKKQKAIDDLKDVEDADDEAIDAGAAQAEAISKEKQDDIESPSKKLKAADDSKDVVNAQGRAISKGKREDTPCKKEISINRVTGELEFIDGEDDEGVKSNSLGSLTPKSSFKLPLQDGEDDDEELGFMQDRDVPKTRVPELNFENDGCIMIPRNATKLRRVHRRRHIITHRRCLLDPFGVPIGNEASECLIRIYESSKKMTLRVGGRVLDFAFVCECCRVSRRHRVTHRRRHIVTVPRWCPLDPYGVPIENEAGESLIRIYESSMKVKLRVGGRVQYIAFVCECCRVRCDKDSTTFELP